MRRNIFTAFLFIFLLSIQFSNAEELYYTYAGPLFHGGANKITYTDWFGEKEDTKKINGNFYSPGFNIGIYTSHIIGDMNVTYTINQNDSDTSIRHMTWEPSIKYNYEYKDAGFTIGAGLYVETPPYSKKYDGAGFTISTGCYYDIRYDWKMIFNIDFRYGYFGLGDGSSKMSYGASLGILRRFGKL